MSDHTVAASKAVDEVEEERDAGDMAGFKDACEVGSVLGSPRFIKLHIVTPWKLSLIRVDVLVAEVVALKRLKYPNIASYHGFSNEVGMYLLVLEYCNHCGVRKMIDEQKVVRANCQAGFEADAVLEYCHSMGQVHRDVKAENILGLSP
ncbi:CAMK protein kinase [Phytophthora palmivora]|uniref:CAMK protein kinase n=1 Tax=Phytophthora palmivora TaxID=4796 RepID=A0A2P4XXX2_9STRA|nr:CAMK protein kinase [Phytophthora palmivora]